MALIVNGRGIAGIRSGVAAGPSQADLDAIAFISAAGITNTTQQSAITTLVSSLKSYGVWTKMKAIYPFVGGTASSHKFNLKDPRDLNAAYRLTFSGGCTHSSTGFLPNGINGFADTNIIPSNVLTSMNNHISFYSRSDIRTPNIPTFGCQSINKQLYVTYYNTSTQSVISSQNGDAGRILFTETNSLGMILGSRTSSTSLKGYRNNILKGTDTTTATTLLPDINIYLNGDLYKSGAGIFYTGYGNRECAFASIGDGLTDTEAANLYTSVQTYQTTLGRNV